MRYSPFSKLGKGSNAIAFKAEHKITKQCVVIKINAIFEKKIIVLLTVLNFELIVDSRA